MGLHCLSGPFWKATSVRNFRKFTISMNEIFYIIKVIYLTKVIHTLGGVEATLGTASIVISSLSRGLGMGVDVAEGPCALGNLAAILCLACG